MLTRKQSELLKFIDQRLKVDGTAPSFDEMREAVGLQSKSGIHRLIIALEERGFLRRLPHRARALEVLHMPNPPEPKSASVKPVAVPEQNNTVVPLYGRIAAGTPIEALQDNARTVSIPPAMLGRGEHYALEVAGDSMIDAGIMDGDTVIIRRGDTAENGAIVVALLVEDNEATLKRFYRRDGKIALEAANPAYETRILAPNQITVQGQLVGLLRQY